MSRRIQPVIVFLVLSIAGSAYAQPLTLDIANELMAKQIVTCSAGAGRALCFKKEFLVKQNYLVPEFVLVNAERKAHGRSVLETRDERYYDTLFPVKKLVPLLVHFKRDTNKRLAFKYGTLTDVVVDDIKMKGSDTAIVKFTARVAPSPEIGDIRADNNDYQLTAWYKQRKRGIFRGKVWAISKIVDLRQYASKVHGYSFLDEEEFQRANTTSQKEWKKFIADHKDYNWKK